MDYPRYPISELHLGKFPDTLEFPSWKVNFKTEVCATSVFPQITMHWIKEVEIGKSTDDLLTSQSITRRRGFTEYEMLDARIASSLKKILTSVHFRMEVSVEEQRAQKDDRFLRGRQIAYMIYEYFRATVACEAVQGLSDLLRSRFRHKTGPSSISSKWNAYGNGPGRFVQVKITTIQNTIPEALRKCCRWIGTLWFLQEIESTCHEAWWSEQRTSWRSELGSIVSLSEMSQTWIAFVSGLTWSRGIWCLGISWSWRLVVWSLLSVLVIWTRPDDPLSLCWLHGEVDAFDSHVKRVMTREFVFPIHWVRAQQGVDQSEALESSWTRGAQRPLVRTMIWCLRQIACVSPKTLWCMDRVWRTLVILWQFLLCFSAREECAHALARDTAHPILSALSRGTKSRHTGHRDTRVAQPHEHVRTDVAYCAERKLFSERVVGVEEQRAQ